MIFDERYSLEKGLFNFFSLTNDAGQIAYHHTKIVKLDIYLKPYTKINSKWNHDLNWKLNSKKSSKKTEQKSFSTLHLAMIYVCARACVCVWKTPKSQINWGKTEYLGLMKKIFTSKDTISRVKGSPQIWRKHLKIMYLIRDIQNV